MKIITTLNGHVLIRPKKTDAPSGIDIPDSVDQERPTMGEVVAGGRDKDGRAISEGQTVLFSTLHPRKVTHDGEECLIVPGEDIYAVIEE